MRSCPTAFLVATMTATALGQSQRDPVKEQAILDQLRKIAPASVKDFEAGTAALDAEDYVGAGAAHQKVVDKAPGVHPGLSRLGPTLAYSGRIPEGKQFLANAVHTS